jgi:hypothetical protein
LTQGNAINKLNAREQKKKEEMEAECKRMAEIADKDKVKLKKEIKKAEALRKKEAKEAKVAMKKTEKKSKEKKSMVKGKKVVMKKKKLEEKGQKSMETEQKSMEKEQKSTETEKKSMETEQKSVMILGKVAIEPMEPPSSPESPVIPSEEVLIIESVEYHSSLPVLVEMSQRGTQPGDVVMEELMEMENFFNEDDALFIDTDTEAL